MINILVIDLEENTNSSLIRYLVYLVGIQNRKVTHSTKNIPKIIANSKGGDIAIPRLKSIVCGIEISYSLVLHRTKCYPRKNKISLDTSASGHSEEHGNPSASFQKQFRP